MRALRILFYLFILGGLIVYGAARFPHPTLSMCLAEPSRYDGVVIHVGNETTVPAVEDSSFTILYLGRPVYVQGCLPPSSIGKFVNFNARFIAPDRLQAQEVRVAVGRRWKIWVSIAPAVVMIGWFFRRFRFCPATFAFQER